jgi:hypothetical protein
MKISLPKLTPSFRKAGKKISASGIVLGMNHLVKYMWRRNRKA